MSDSVEFTAERIVKPRANATPPRFYPVIAVHKQEAVTETGEAIGRDNLLGTLPMRVPSIVVCDASAAFLADVTDRYGSERNFQWKCSSREREIILPSTEGSEVTVCQLDTIVHFFGWKGHRESKRREANRYHLCIDPIVFYGRNLSELGYTGNRLSNLLRWCVSLRDWCNDNQIAIRPTAGGLGSQFLRDRRFYPESRRKVPAATNESVREHLPGNYYYLQGKTNGQEYTGIYIDQTRAHHYHARTIRLPDANSLYAYGDFQELQKVTFSYADFEPNFAGLYYGRIDGKLLYWYTSEWDYLRDKGHRCNGIIAAWGSTESDGGIAKYSKWAESELDKYDNASWLKPILLSTYGLLAAKPREVSFGFHHAQRGTPGYFQAGARTLAAMLCGTGKKIEPTFANVLHRALIEAATRAESLGLAEWLEWKGFTVLSIYADAVIIDADTDLTLPSLPKPWRVKQTLHHLRFINSQAFVSGEMTKLPGSVGRTEALAASMGTVGIAPNKPYYEAVSGRRLESWELQNRKSRPRKNSLTKSERIDHLDLPVFAP